MALDAEGRAVQRMRSFTHLMPGEQQNCVGCHANRSHLAPSGHQRPLAALRDAEELVEPEWGVRGFSYAHIVQPVLDAHCVDCHSAQRMDGGVDLSPDLTDFFNVSYEHLARKGQPGMNPYTKWIPTFNGQEANILRVEPKYWGSPASSLAEIILSGHRDREGNARVQLSRAARRRVFTWIDLDVPYYGTSKSNHYDLPGCRQLVPENLDAVLKEVAERRCNMCHQTSGVPRQPYVRITNVHHNSFLLAPLSVEGGGTGRCGKAVFKSKDDPDYRAILETFTPIRQQLNDRPRMDIVTSEWETICPL
jgi:mono/diheme cytochrome c family protein